LMCHRKVLLRYVSDEFHVQAAFSGRRCAKFRASLRNLKRSILVNIAQSWKMDGGGDCGRDVQGRSVPASLVFYFLSSQKRQTQNKGPVPLGTEPLSDSAMVALHAH
jgi:hypothetical protein